MTQQTSAGNILILSAEDGLADTIKPRLDKLGADCDRIIAAKELFTLDKDGLTLLIRQIEKYKPKLVIIDPLAAYIGTKMDIYRSNQVRAFMASLAEIAEQYSCAVVLVRHLTKSDKSKAIYRGVGSIDFVGAARSQLLAGCDPDDDSKRAVVHTKCNVGPIGKAIGFRIGNGDFFWESESNLTAETMLRGNSEGDVSALAEAVDFLRKALEKGSLFCTDLFNQAEENRIALPTLKRAKRKLNVKSYKDGFSGKWKWQLPNDPSPNQETSDSSDEAF